AVTGRTLDVSITPDKERWLGYGSYNRVMDTLEALFADGRAHVLGDRFTAVDVYLGAQIGWGLQFGTVEDRPGFKEYAQRAEGRAAAKRATQKDDALMAQGDGAGA